MAVTSQGYIYVSPDRRVKVILVEAKDGILRVAGDVKSKSRDLDHHVELYISNNCVRFSCSCEASAHGLLCDHVKDLYNVFMRNREKLAGGVV